MDQLDIFPGDENRSPFDQIKHVRDDGSEYWSARELMPLMGYPRWSDFQNPLGRAMSTARNQGQRVEEVFRRSPKNSGSRGGRPSEDYELTRFAAYLVAMNGDPNKSEVAGAQAYFAIRTHESETRQVNQAPTTFLEALKAAAAAEEARLELEAKRAIDAPKVDYVDTFVADEDTLLFRTVASDLNVSESWLRSLLIEKKWIYAEKSSRYSRNAGRVKPTTRYAEYSHKKPYFYRHLLHDAPRFRGEVDWTLKITPPGAAAIAKLVRSNLPAAKEDAL